jgi:hypothetical protein
MKSKKIVAMIVAFAAFMAVATSGLAAVTTTTEYYTNDANKVSVEVAVTSAAAGSEVTYLVESGEDIVYIDQQTADENGAVNFNYKISKGKLTDYAATVKFGTDGNKSIDYAADDNIAFNGITADIDANAIVGFYLDVNCNSAVDVKDIKVGDKDVIYALVDFAVGYELDTMSGLEKATGNVYKVTDINNVVVKAKPSYVAPGATIDPTVNSAGMSAAPTTTTDSMGNEIAAKAVTTIVKVVGTPSEVGVKWENPKTNETWEFPALGLAGYEDVKLRAVRIVMGVEEIVDGLQAYFK